MYVLPARLSFQILLLLLLLEVSALGLHNLVTQTWDQLCTTLDFTLCPTWTRTMRNGCWTASKRPLTSLPLIPRQTTQTNTHFGNIPNFMLAVLSLMHYACWLKYTCWTTPVRTLWCPYFINSFVGLKFLQPLSWKLYKKSAREPS